MNCLIIANSVQNQDLYYATGFLCHDPFIFIQKGNKKYIFVSLLEEKRAKKEVRKDVKVECFEKYLGVVETKKQKPTLLEISLYLLKKFKIKEVTLPLNFSWVWANKLKKSGFKLLKKIPLFESRVIKSNSEIDKISDVQYVVEKAMGAAISIISRSRIKGRYLILNNEKLTSEILKTKIRNILLKGGCLDFETIVSCGARTIVPHDTGSGPIFANKSIIIDIFPRSEKTRYFSDMTRTVCKGKPPKKLFEIYELVKEAQKIGISCVRSGITGAYVHQKIVSFFEKKGMSKYFIHGTGHGVGLDIHESPKVGLNGTELKEGMVITIEPGLYVEGVGGVRLEDIVVVTKTGCKNLTKMKKEFVLK